MEMYKSVAPRFEGMGLKLYKFHILKKWYFYISLYGSPNNGDSSRCETGHIYNLKKCGRKTQQRADTINYQTGIRYYEMNLIRRITIECGVYDKITKYEREMIEKKEREERHAEGLHDIDLEEQDLIVTTKGPYFRLFFSYSADGDKVSIAMKWLNKKNGDPSKNQTDRTSFEMPILSTVKDKLHGYNGGKEMHRLISIDGSAKSLLSNNNGDGTQSIRACPSYRSGAPWNDFVSISWENEAILRARVMMILDFESCDFEDVSDMQTELSESSVGILGREHMIRIGVHAIVHSASSQRRTSEDERIINSKISNHYLMEKDKLQMISINLVRGLIFAIPDVIDSTNNDIQSLITVSEVPYWSSHFFDYEKFEESMPVPNFDSETFHWEEIE